MRRRASKFWAATALAAILVTGCTGQSPGSSPAHSAALGMTASQTTSAPPAIPESPSTVTSSGTVSADTSASEPPPASSSPDAPTGPSPTASAGATKAGEESATSPRTVARPVPVHQLPRDEPPVNWNFDAAGKKYAVIHGRELFAPTRTYDHPTQQAVVVRRADHEVVFRYDPPTIDRYVHRSFFYGKYVILLVGVIGATDLNVPPNVWAVRIDPETGDSVNLTKRLGVRITGFPSDITVTGRYVVAATPNATSKGMQRRECFTAVDIVTGRDRAVGCSPDATVVSFVDATPDGVSYLVSPLGKDLLACRHRYLIDVSTGVHKELDDGHNCRVWDGTELSGWAVWSSPTKEDNDDKFIEDSTVFARGPDGRVYTLGVSQSSHMFVCGKDVYFETQVESPKAKATHKEVDVLFDSLVSLQRWRPGSPMVDTVYSVDAYDHRRFAAPVCTDDVVRVGYFGTDEHGIVAFLQSEWFPARTS